MKDGWQMNGRWKEGGLMIELFKTTRASMKFDRMIPVEKSVFSIWVDLPLCRSIQLLVLSYAEMFVYMYLSQLMSTFTKLSKGASSSRWFLHSMTRRTSDSTITHMYLYTHDSQI